MSDETCAVFFSIACNTGSIQYPDCMLKTFTRPSKGAVAFVGATAETYLQINNLLNKSIFKKLLNDSVYRIGDLIIAAHAQCIIMASGDFLKSAKDNSLSYVIGGDPTLELWTKESQLHSVSFNIANNNVNMTVYPMDDDSLYCSVVDAEAKTHVGNLMFTGQSISFPKPSYNFYAVVNRHNYRPHLVYCDFTTNDLVHSIIDYDAHFYAMPMTLQDGLSDDDIFSYGVTVKNGGKLYLHKGNESVSIINSFKCEKGGILHIE